MKAGDTDTKAGDSKSAGIDVKGDVKSAGIDVKARDVPAGEAPVGAAAAVATEVAVAGDDQRLFETAARLRLAIVRTARRLRQEAGSDLGPTLIAALGTVD